MREGEIHIFHLAQVFHPVFGDVAVSDHRAQDARRRCRVAVRVLAAAGGDIHRFEEVFFPVQQSDYDIGAVDDGIDVERAEYAAGTAHVLVPLPGGFEPGLLPVVGVLLVPADHVVDALVEFALLGNRFQRLGHHELHIVRDKSQRIHRPDINPAVPTVAVAHDMSYLIRNFGCAVGHSRIHQSCEIGFDLEVEVVCMGVVEPVSRLGGHNPVQDVIAGRLVCVPQAVFGRCESHRDGIHRGIEAETVEYLHERQVHIHIVVQTRGSFVPPFDITVRPRDRGVIRNHAALEVEFGGPSVGTSDGLAGPASLDFIEKHLFRHGYTLGQPRGIAGMVTGRQENRQQRYKNK